MESGSGMCDVWQPTPFRAQNDVFRYKEAAEALCVSSGREVVPNSSKAVPPYAAIKDAKGGKKR
jgi:hypothetical protein